MHTSCTIEMANLSRRVDVAVIDEIQASTPSPAPRPPAHSYLHTTIQTCRKHRSRTSHGLSSELAIFLFCMCRDGFMMWPRAQFCASCAGMLAADPCVSHASCRQKPRRGRTFLSMPSSAIFLA